MQSATVVLEEPVANVALLNPTDLVAPGSTIPKAGVVVTQVGTDPEVEIISVAVTVPNNQTEALYRGFITDGAAVLVDVIANVHT
jgi:hypothetical protein